MGQIYSMPKKQTHEEYINYLLTEYPYKVDVSLVKYVNSATKVHLICLECKTNFFPTPQDTKKKPRPSGCPTCGRAKTQEMLNSRIVTPDILEARFREKHGNKFEYDWSTYTTLHSRMKMYCPSHEWVYTTPSNHEQGADCWFCGIETRSVSHTVTYEEAIIRSRLRHGDTYEYTEEGYTGAKGKLGVICKKHGLKPQYANDHWSGHGCDECSPTISKGQAELCKFLEGLGLRIKVEYPLKSTKRIDVVCLDLGIGFEYDGLWWHCEANNPEKTYHLRKNIEAEAEGIRLVHIYEDEWIRERERVENWILALVGLQSEKYNARSLEVGKCSWSEAAVFLERHHLQGKGASGSTAYSLRDKDTGDIMAVMAFSGNNTKDGSIELTRFCSKGLVRGGFTKLLKAFITEYGNYYDEIVSFSDERWSQGGVYQMAGFTKVSTSRPDYCYVKGGRRMHKRGFQRKYLERKLKNFDPSKSESENCLANGFYKLWDCGKTKWSLSL